MTSPRKARIARGSRILPSSPLIDQLDDNPYHSLYDWSIRAAGSTTATLAETMATPLSRTRQMPDPKIPDDAPLSGEPSPPSEPEPVKQGGFGAFADVYRARWALNHPHMRRAESGTASPEPPAGAETVRVRPFAEDGTRLIRPGDRK